MTDSKRSGRLLFPQQAAAINPVGLIISGTTRLGPAL
jgi:hypothetical protein